MNAITTTPATEQEVLRVLENSLYPGAKPESIQLVLSYCRVNGLDPMLKPVHIVPTNVKVGHNKYEWRDVLMPGIADYRIKASRSGDYVGKSEPFFGPDVTEDVGNIHMTYPRWCKITVQRFVRNEVRDFTAVEYWLENYATAGKDSDDPNRMWKKRAYGQLAKCAEAQALRMAFPEFSGGVPTAEEMEGKFDGPMIEHEAKTPVSDARARINAEIPLQQGQVGANPPQRTRGQFLDGLEIAARDCGSLAEVNRMIAHPDTQRAMATFQDAHKARLDGIIAQAIAAHAPVEHPDPDADDGWPGPTPESMRREREAADA